MVIDRWDCFVSNEAEVIDVEPTRELTKREREFVLLVMKGKANKDIAAELGIKVGSVKEYMHRIFIKIGVNNRTEVAIWGFSKGMDKEVEIDGEETR